MKFKVTLSSIESRKRFIDDTIRSLIAQESDDGFSVDLYLPKQKVRGGQWLDSDIKKLKEKYTKDPLNIKSVKDIGPLTKFWYALKSQEDISPVISADDDVLYPKDWAKNLIRYHEFFPRALVCHRGRILDETKKIQ